MGTNNTSVKFCSHLGTPYQGQPSSVVQHDCWCGAFWECPLCGLRNPAFSTCCCPRGDHNHDTKPRCEDIGFVHAWEDETQQATSVSAAMKIKPRRRCLNCDRVEEYAVVQPEVCKWQVIDIGR